MTARLDAGTRENLEAELMRLDGVLHAALDARSGESVWVVRDPAYMEGPLELAVRNRLAAHGHDPARLAVRITLPSSREPRRRVRFEGVERAEQTGRVTITVTLEWDDVIHTGEATGERGPAIELKTTARAAIRALESLTGETLDVRIIGVKTIHAFDSDLMVASLHHVAGSQHRLVGAVIVSDDPLAAAAVAVLSALNRTLGNFLHTSD